MHSQLTSCAPYIIYRGLWLHEKQANFIQTVLKYRSITVKAGSADTGWSRMLY